MPRSLVTALSPLAALGLLLSTGCAGIHTLDTARIRTVSLPDYQAEIARAPEAWKLPPEGVILKVAKGLTLPLNVEVTTTIASLVPGANKVRLDRDLYLYLSPTSVELSPDGERWAVMGNFRGFQELFGAHRGGSFQLGLGVTKGEGPFVTVKVEQH